MNKRFCQFDSDDLNELIKDAKVRGWSNDESEYAIVEHYKGTACLRRQLVVSILVELIVYAYDLSCNFEEDEHGIRFNAMFIEVKDGLPLCHTMDVSSYVQLLRDHPTTLSNAMFSRRRETDPKAFIEHDLQIIPANLRRSLRIHTSNVANKVIRERICLIRYSTPVYKCLLNLLCHKGNATNKTVAAVYNQLDRKILQSTIRLFPKRSTIKSYRSLSRVPHVCDFVTSESRYSGMTGILLSFDKKAWEVPSWQDIICSISDHIAEKNLPLDEDSNVFYPKDMLDAEHEIRQILKSYGASKGAIAFLVNQGKNVQKNICSPLSSAVTTVSEKDKVQNQHQARRIFFDHEITHKIQIINMLSSFGKSKLPSVLLTWLLSSENGYRFRCYYLSALEAKSNRVKHQVAVTLSRFFYSTALLAGKKRVVREMMLDLDNVSDYWCHLIEYPPEIPINPRMTWRSMVQRSEQWHEELSGQSDSIIGNHKWSSCLEETTVDGWLVTPLTTSRLLKKEGDRMQTCVGTYWAECAYDGYRIFSITHPEKDKHHHATLCLAQNKKNNWFIQQNKSYANSDVSPEIDAVSRTVLELYKAAFHKLNLEEGAAKVTEQMDGSKT